MCGFNGYFYPGFPKEKGLQLLKEMNRIIAHRGPDGDGFWQNTQIGLAHRRLSIIDLEGGHQPMVSTNEKFVIVFNGEIYNYKSLKKELQGKGYTFQTNSDTEVIPYIIDHFGPNEGLKKLRGMFAFALYDKVKHQILLARDYVGIKPVYFSQLQDGSFLFGSEIKSFLHSGLIGKKINTNSLLDFLITGHCFAPDTIWKNITELPPGHWAEINENGYSIQSYWKWEFNTQKVSETQSLEELEEVLKDSVQHHLISDVKIASFLSGGVDSSLISAIACKHYDPELMTFNVGFKEKKYDESPYARMVAEQYHSNHHEVIVEQNAGDPDLFQKILNLYDQPFGDSSCLPTYFICGEIAQHVKVVLSGDGGDELFGGYERYKTINTLHRVNKVPLSKPLLQLAGQLVSPLHLEKGRQLKKAGTLLNDNPKDLILGLLTYFNPKSFRKILHPDLYAYAQKNYQCGLLSFIPSDGDNFTDQFIATEINALLHADYLRKVDIASMAHSLEVRTPFLDQKLFEFSSKLPISYKIRKGETKYLLKKLGEKYLPHALIYRPKQGFGIPFDKWADNGKMKAFIHDTLFSDKALEHSVINLKYKQQLWDGFHNGKTNELGLSRYQIYQQVFMLLSLNLFFSNCQPHF